MRAKNVIGQRFGKLIVIARDCASETKSRAAKWLCKCDCGNSAVVRGTTLRSVGTPSCGCYRNEMAIRSFFRRHPGAAASYFERLEMAGEAE